MKFVELTKWNKYFFWPSLKFMGFLFNNRKSNGAEEFLIILNNKFCIDINKFKKWAKENKKYVMQRN